MEDFQEQIILSIKSDIAWTKEHEDTPKDWRLKLISSCSCRIQLESDNVSDVDSQFTAIYFNASQINTIVDMSDEDLSKLVN